MGGIFTMMLKHVSFAIAEIKEFFSQDNDMVFCNDVCCVIEALGPQHDPPEWRLFMDSSEVSLKAVLLHNGNKSRSLSLPMPLT
jgi:hypothetical protein